MPFLRRLGYYLLGLSVGLLFLAFFLRKKSGESGIEFCYFPNCRTLKDIRSKPLSYSNTIQQRMASRELDSTDIAYFLREGTVDFKKSDIAPDRCSTYFIEGTLKDRKATLEVENCPERAQIVDLAP